MREHEFRTKLIHTNKRNAFTDLKIIYLAVVNLYSSAKRVINHSIGYLIICILTTHPFLIVKYVVIFELWFAVDVAQVWMIRNACSTFVGKSIIKRILGRSRNIWTNTTNLDLSVGSFKPSSFAARELLYLELCYQF